MKREDCETPEEHSSHNIDGIMKHAVDRGNRQEQKSQPVKDFHPFKMGAPPPGNEKRSGNMGAWKGCAGIFSLGVNKIHESPERALVMSVFSTQGDRPLNRQDYEDEITDVEQGGELEHEALEEAYILAGQQNAGQGNDQIKTKVIKMKEFVEESIPRVSMEEESGKFTEDEDIQIHKKAVQELGDDNPVEQAGLIVK